MAVKSIIDLQLNDGPWVKFQEQFKEYQDLLSKTPGAWQRVNKAVDDVADGLDGVVDSSGAVVEKAKATQTAFHQNVILLHQHNDITNQIAKSQPRIQDGVKSQARSWHQMARDTKSFASNIHSATTSLLRWASITGVISGLVGAGGLFGIDRLAMSAGNARRSSLGLGVTPGEQSAFSLNFGRVVNTDQVLGGVNEALTDPSKRVGLYGAGLTENDIRGKDAAQVSAELIPALKKLADQTPANMLGAVLRARHLDQFISPEDFQRLRNTPAGEIAGYGRQFQADARGLDLTKGQQKAWQDLQVQLSRAGREIERTFIVGLTPLAPVIGHLSDSFTKAVEAFLGSPKIKEFLDDVATGLDHFATEVGTPEFAQTVRSFAADIVTLADAVGRAIHVVAKWFGGDSSKTPDEKKAWDEEEGRRKNDQDAWDAAHGRKPQSTPDIINKPLPWAGNPLTGGGSPAAPKPAPVPGTSGANATDWNYVSPTAFRPGNDNFTSGVSPALLASVEYQESRGRDVTNARSGAAGYYQFMPATAAQYGVDVHNERSSMNGARRYLTDLSKMFGGDIAETLAAYNWGPGNVKKDLARHGADWRKFLPKETQQYVDQVTGRLPRQGGQQGQQFKDRSVTVTVRNATGGNAIVTANQLSA